jgi:hypothetical protein
MSVFVLLLHKFSGNLILPKIANLVQLLSLTVSHVLLWVFLASQAAQSVLTLITLMPMVFVLCVI